MIHLNVFNYGYDWVDVVNAPQGGSAEGIAKAKQMLEEVTRAFAEAAKNADEAAEVERQKEAKQTAPQKKAEKGSLFAYNAALNELGKLDKEYVMSP